MIFHITDASQIAAARRAAAAMGEEIGLDADRLGRAALVVTELATNLHKHAQQGRIILRHANDPTGAYLDIMSVDQGPGMSNVAQASAQGYSTTGTSGSGMGIIGRQADSFEVFSRADKGTVASARIFQTAPSAKVAIGAVVDNYPGEQVCGDGWLFADTAAGPTLLVVDGTGHGLLAAKAAGIAADIFTTHAEKDIVDIVERIHGALLSTRGAAVAVARIDAASRQVRFVGVGNIAGATLTGGEVKRMVSHNGTAGHLAPRIREFTYPFTSPPAVVMHSDGLSARWDLNEYPGLSVAHPSLIAGVLFRDFRRGRDDATVVCMRIA